MVELDATQRLGRLVEIETEGRALRAYVPATLPFSPPLQLGPRLQGLLQSANLALGRLDGAAGVLPNRDLLLSMYMRKEAALTSQIEGTVATLEDLLLFEESPRLRNDDLREMVNYMGALQMGASRIASGSAISLELIEQLHGRLMRSERGRRNQPGRLRSKQNFVGGRRLLFVPPPADYVGPAIENLVAYIADPREDSSALIRAGVAHVQFETIHPFMDGNGRLGRMLITLMLVQAGMLRWPLFIPSLFLKENRSEYFALLNDVREHGDWESWLVFFLQGAVSAAQAAASGAIAISELLRLDRARVAEKLGGSALVVYEQLLIHPTVRIPLLATLSGYSEPTVRRALRGLEQLGICREVTGGERNRRYRYDAYLDLLNAGTETRGEDQHT